MFGFIMRAGAAALAALVLASGATGAAAAESASKMALASDLGRQFVGFIDLDNAIEQSLTRSDSGGIFALQPQWRGLLADAFRQLDRDREVIVALLARALAPRFSEEGAEGGFCHPERSRHQGPRAQPQ